MVRTHCSRKVVACDTVAMRCVPLESNPRGCCRNSSSEQHILNSSLVALCAGIISHLAADVTPTLVLTWYSL